jgi:hypothetical protein
MTIQEIVDHAMAQVSSEIAKGKLDLRSIIYAAVQSGMADAYQRGIDAGSLGPL